MKRTGEIVLTSIGAFLYLLTTIAGFFLARMFNNEEFTNQLSEEARRTDPEVSMEEMQAVWDFFQGIGSYIAIVSIIGIILGIVSIVLVKGNKKPKAAGIILIVTAVLGTIISVGGGILSGVLYLIAGIMCLARKQQPTQTLE